VRIKKKKKGEDHLILVACFEREAARKKRNGKKKIQPPSSHHDTPYTWCSPWIRLHVLHRQSGGWSSFGCQEAMSEMLKKRGHLPRAHNLFIYLFNLSKDLNDYVLT
jgi:hypothetical protein